MESINSIESMDDLGEIDLGEFGLEDFADELGDLMDEFEDVAAG